MLNQSVAILAVGCAAFVAGTLAGGIGVTVIGEGSRASQAAKIVTLTERLAKAKEQMKAEFTYQRYVIGPILARHPEEQRELKVRTGPDMTIYDPLP